MSNVAKKVIFGIVIIAIIALFVYAITNLFIFSDFDTNRNAKDVFGRNIDIKDIKVSITDLFQKDFIAISGEDKKTLIEDLRKLKIKPVISKDDVDMKNYCRFIITNNTNNITIRLNINEKTVVINDEAYYIGTDEVYNDLKNIYDKYNDGTLIIG